MPLLDATTIDVALRLLGILFLLYWTWRLFHPLRCSCGRIFWLHRRMYRHQAQSHKYTEQRSNR